MNLITDNSVYSLLLSVVILLTEILPWLLMGVDS